MKKVFISMLLFVASQTIAQNTTLPKCIELGLLKVDSTINVQEIKENVKNDINFKPLAYCRSYRVYLIILSDVYFKSERTALAGKAIRAIRENNFNNGNEYLY